MTRRQIMNFVWFVNVISLYLSLKKSICGNAVYHITFGFCLSAIEIMLMSFLNVKPPMMADFYQL